MQNSRGKQIMSMIGANGNPGGAPLHVFSSAVGDKKRFSSATDNSNVESEQRKKSASSSTAGKGPSQVSRPNTASSVPSASVDVDAILAANGVAAGAAPTTSSANRNKKNNRNDKAQGQIKTGGHSAQQNSTPMAVDAPAAEEKAAYLTDHSFQTLDISPNTIRAIVEVMKFKFMTLVQHASLPEILKGHDALVKAKTGTGKTVGFLVPAIEILMKERQRLAASRGPQPRILILSPTRELAQQIATEAQSLCTFHRIGITLLVGGTNMGSDVKALRTQGEGHSDIIVATPGRMVAHLKDTPGFAEMVKGVKVFCMDEADRLLDMGFSKDIGEITRFLNQRNSAALGKRQTLLFSATVSPEIQDIARTTLLPGYKFIDTVGEEVEQTHAHVPQKVMVVPLDDQVRAMVAIIEEQKRANPEYKMILFFPTARQTGFYAGVLNRIGLRVLEIHSRKSQSHRTRVSEEFRAGKNVILLSSDVSARGMDYPDVSFVLQVGMTMRDQYIHRLGRTARAGKEGAGLLVLAPFEQRAMMKELADLPLIEVPPPAALTGAGSALMQRAAEAIAVDDGDAGEDDGSDGEGGDNAARAWGAWLGYYNGQLKKINMDKAQLVQLSGHYANSIGLPEIPPLPKRTISMMGMQGVPGLRIMTNPPPRGNGRGGGGGGGGGRGGPPPAAGGGGRGGGNGNGNSNSNNGGRGGGGGGGQQGGPAPHRFNPSGPPPSQHQQQGRGGGGGGRGGGNDRGGGGRGGGGRF